MLRAILVLCLMLGLSATVARADGASVDADGTVTIHPGETITVAFAGVDDPSHPKLASAGDTATMTFTFADHEGIGLILEIQSHLSVTVKYDAVMVVHGNSVHTSSCPVPAKIMGTENWRDPITELKLSGFRKLDGTSFVCD